MDSNFQFLQTLLQLGWPAIVLVQCVLLWRDSLQVRDRYISFLEKQINEDARPDTPTFHPAENQ